MSVSGVNSNQVTWSTAQADLNTFENDAAHGSSPIALTNAYNTISSDFASMYSQGSLTQSQYTQINSALSDMASIAGEPGHNAQWNNDLSTLTSLVTPSSTGSTASGASLAPLSLTSQSGVNALQKLWGDGSTSFADFAKKFYGNDIVYQSGTKNLDAAATAAKLAAAHIDIYQDSSGNTVTYDPATRTGGGFSGSGGSVTTPSWFYPGNNKGLSQTGDQVFQVGGMTVTFGTGGRDSKNNVYGISVNEGGLPTSTSG